MGLFHQQARNRERKLDWSHYAEGTAGPAIDNIGTGPGAGILVLIAAGLLPTPGKKACHASTPAAAAASGGSPTVPPKVPESRPRQPPPTRQFQPPLRPPSARSVLTPPPLATPQPPPITSPSARLPLPSSVILPRLPLLTDSRRYRRMSTPR